MGHCVARVPLCRRESTSSKPQHILRKKRNTQWNGGGGQRTGRVFAIPRRRSFLQLSLTVIS